MCVTETTIVLQGNTKVVFRDDPTKPSVWDSDLNTDDREEEEEEEEDTS